VYAPLVGGTIKAIARAGEKGAEKLELVAPAVGDPYADLLMFAASGQNLPTRLICK
jgi:hypothetical protein